MVVYFILFNLRVLLEILVVLVPVLIAVAYLTLVERKVLASMQRRVGPNVVGFLGLLQPIADAAKLIFKETILPTLSNKFIFIFAAVFTFCLSLVAWTVIPFYGNYVIADLNVGLLYIFAISSLHVYGIIMAGWSSNSRYAFLGSLRSASQMVSYEVSIGLILISVLMCVGSLNLLKIIEYQRLVWFIFPLFPAFIMFFVSSLAETARAPFDLPEAENELVAGYNVEYASIPFALFFIGEYANILLMSSLSVIFFLGGWYPPAYFIQELLNVFIIPWFFLLFFEISLLPGFLWFSLKLAFMFFLFIWVRATFPRYRYDQLMRLGWKVFLPLSLALVILTASVLLAFGWSPVIV